MRPCAPSWAAFQRLLVGRVGDSQFAEVAAARLLNDRVSLFLRFRYVVRGSGFLGQRNQDVLRFVPPVLALPLIAKPVSASIRPCGSTVMRRRTSSCYGTSAISIFTNLITVGVVVKTVIGPDGCASDPWSCCSSVFAMLVIA